MDVQKLLMELLSSPAGAAVIAKFLTGFIHSQLLNLDKSGTVEQYSKYVQPATIVLSSLAALLSLALQGHAGSFDPTTVVSLVTAALVAHNWDSKKNGAK